MSGGNEDGNTQPLIAEYVPKLDFIGGNLNSPSLDTGYLLHEFKILSVLGIGGFGITYLAEDTRLRLQVAIKEYFPSDLAIRDKATGSVSVKHETYVSDFEWGKSRFSQEAQTLAQFRHPNIVQVLRFFEANGTCYMVMDYEDGKSLEELLTTDRTSWPEEKILKLLRPLLDGVTHVHQAGFLHRDFTPSNIYIRAKDGSPVLLDFGSARQALVHHTKTLTSFVKPGYAPLEQYFDEGTQGAWSDIYSIGAVVYRIVTGAPPRPAPARIKKDAMVPLIFAGHQKYSPAFLRAVDQALSIDEEKRPQSITDWLPKLEGKVPVELAATENANESNSENGSNPKRIPPSGVPAANQVPVNIKRTFYDLLQVGRDADIDTITKSYQRLLSAHQETTDPASRNELVFIKHAFETLSNTNKRSVYDKKFTDINSKVQVESISIEDAKRVFVGDNYEYYEKKWEKIDDAYFSTSWNLAAFICGAGWLAYRKMYAFLIPIMFYYVIVYYIITQPQLQQFPKTGFLFIQTLPFVFLPSFFCGTAGILWFKTYVNKKVRYILNNYSSGEVTPELKRKGGTSIIMGRVFSFFHFIFTLAMLFKILSIRFN